jgi:hypothetical protein
MAKGRPLKIGTAAIIILGHRDVTRKKIRWAPGAGTGASLGAGFPLL